MQKCQVRCLASFFAMAVCPDTSYFFFRAGRYDSAERHCRNCPGFLEMDSTANMFPVQITKGEHKVIRMFRSTAMCDVETISQALNIRDRMLRMMSDEMTLVYGFNAMNINADSEESFIF
jgi:hypothetical protein